MLSPLLIAKQILQDASQTTAQHELVELIVRRIRDALQVDVCSLYLVDEHDTLVLSATEGLASGAIGKIRMSLGDGLVGTIASTQHVLNLVNAEKHAKFKYFDDIGEELYQGFLGVPMIQRGRVLGVLVVQVREQRRFSEDEEAFLITMGAHLVANKASSLRRLNQQQGETPVRRFHGLAGAPGVAVAKCWVVRKEVSLEAIDEREGNGLEYERKAFNDALTNTLEELKSDSQTHTDSETLSALINVYQMLLTSPELQQTIDKHLRNNLSAGTSIKHGMLEQVAVFDAMDDPYLKARADDLRMLGARLYRQLQNFEPEIIQTDSPVILVGENITVEHFSMLDYHLIAGVVSNQGSTLSHTSVLANALGIPAVVGISEPDIRSLHQHEAIIDGDIGQVIVNPPEQLKAEFKQVIEQQQARDADLADLKDQPAQTLDGKRIRLLSNTGLLADITPGLERGSEGVGLYRSEIPFMAHNTFPTEEEQTRIYAGVLKAYSPMPVIMRTLDIGGDKALPYFPINEENPFLGWRGIRFALDYRNIQLDQIRAMLLANVGHDNLNIMVPMLSHEDELLRVHALIDETIKQLKREGHPVHKPGVGIMAEVPAVIWLLPKLRDHIDFVSIGSNDLTQYLLAVDRNNPRVAHLYSHFHPSVIEAICNVVDECQRLHLPVSVCGEMAADPKAVPLLIGMGITSLSMSAYKLPLVKWLIRHLELDDCQKLLSQVREACDMAATQEIVGNALKDIGFEQLFHQR